MSSNMFPGIFALGNIPWQGHIPGPGSERFLFYAIHAAGIVCFFFIVARRLAPLLRAERDSRFDRPLLRLKRILQFWLGQWKHPRYVGAGAIHILIFAGFIVLAVRTFSVLIFGLSEHFAVPGLIGGAGQFYDILTDYAATIVFFCMVIAAVRRVVFQPARYAVPLRYGKGHPADAIFLLGLIAALMLTDSFFAASHAVGRAGQGPLAPFSLAWSFARPLVSAAPSSIRSLQVSACLLHQAT